MKRNSGVCVMRISTHNAHSHPRQKIHYAQKLMDQYSIGTVGLGVNVTIPLDFFDRRCSDYTSKISGEGRKQSEVGRTLK
jgi:hypothetical protein